VIYRVWYELEDGRLRMVDCGNDAKYAWRIITSYFGGAQYYPYLEYICQK